MAADSGAPKQRTQLAPRQQRLLDLKYQRATKRRQMFLASGDRPSEFLARHCVSEMTRQRYFKLTHDFFQSSGLSPSSPKAKLDRGLSEHMLHLFLSGEQTAAACYIVYALKWRLDLELTDLPLAMKALKGFRSLSHENSRDPNALEAVLAAGAVGLMSSDHKRRITAIISVIQFDLVCRPGEILKIMPEWIAAGPPSKRGRSALVCFFPSTAEETDKVKQQDDTVVAGEVTKFSWISPLLLHLKKRWSAPTGRCSRCP